LFQDLRLLHATPVALDPEKLPSELVVLKWGDNQTPDGIIKVGAVTLRSLAANQILANFDRICLDYNHNTVPDSPFYGGEPCEVAAYGVASVEEGVGIKLCSLEWTESAPKYVGGGHYRDLSPAIKLDPDSGEVIFLHSTAVCRQGAVTGLVLNSSTATHNKTTKMDPKKLLLAILNLAPDATDEEIQAAAEKFGKEEQAEPAHKEGEPKEKPATEKEGGEENLKTLSATVRNISTRIAELTSSLEQEKRDAIISLAASEGKVVPDEVKTLPLADLRSLCAKLPVTVPMRRQTPDTILSITGGAAKVIDPVQREVNRQLGISDEQFAKHA
jgi:phage I-like protein